jgi:hypothetical protein
MAWCSVKKKAQGQLYLYFYLHIWRLFEKRVLRRIFGPKRVEVTGGWRKLHDELHNLYTSPTTLGCSNKGG